MGSFPLLLKVLNGVKNAYPKTPTYIYIKRMCEEAHNYNVLPVSHITSFILQQHVPGVATVQPAHITRADCTS
jgi:hypothetical protein